MLPLGQGGVYTSWFQFSETQDDILPTHFGQRYQDDLKRAANVTPLFHANVTGIRLSRDGGRVDHLDVATLTPAGGAGNRFRSSRAMSCWPAAAWRMRGCCWRPTM